MLSEVMNLATEEELRLHRCCFTGHRPEKLHSSERKICKELEREIRAAVDDGFQTFISGMARGSDIWAAEIVLKLRDKGAPIRLIAASPFEGFELSWSLHWQKKYAAIMAKADHIRFISPSYDRGCFQRRNEWMVNHSSRLIAVFNGGSGGTKNTIDFAAKVGVETVIVEDK